MSKRNSVSLFVWVQFFTFPSWPNKYNYRIAVYSSSVVFVRNDVNSNRLMTCVCYHPCQLPSSYRIDVTWSDVTCAVVGTVRARASNRARRCQNTRLVDDNDFYTYCYSYYTRVINATNTYLMRIQIVKFLQIAISNWGCIYIIHIFLTKMRAILNVRTITSVFFSFYPSFLLIY